MLVLGPVHATAQSIFALSCEADSKIDAAKKKAIDSASTNFAQAMFGANPSSAFTLMSKDGRAATTQQDFDSTIEFIRRFEATNVVLQHTYLIRLTGKSPGRVVCGNVSNPEEWEALAAEDVPEQAHVLLSADTRNNKLAITVWLLPEEGAWKVFGFQVNVSSLADKDSLQLWQMARAQQARQHNFNAALLYFAAAQAAARGPNFQLGIAQSIAEDIGKLTVPVDIKGQPPFLWKNKDITYTVKSVGPLAIGGKIYVMIAHEVSPWQSNSQVDGWNKQLLKDFRRRFPEYSDVFAGLIARAYERGSNRGYGTVEELSSTE
jgi:hypothetical protein